MRNILIGILIIVGLDSAAQRNQVYVKSDVTHHSQVDVDAFYKGYCQTKDLAWQYYNNGDYENAIYYANRVSTSIIDGDYLYTQKTQILCLSYAALGNKKMAKKFYKKVLKKSPPDQVRYVEQQLKSRGIVSAAVSTNEAPVTTKKMYYTPDPTDETGMYNYRKHGR